MIRGIVFDMDGLMFDTERLVIKAWNFAGKQKGYNITEDIVVRTLGLNAENTRHIFLEQLGNDFDYDAIRRVRIDYVTDYIEKNGIPIKTGLTELLDFLKSNHYKMTVATSTDKEKAKYYFQKANISNYFDEIVCGDMIERGKPEPDIYLKASEIIGVSPDECIALEDSIMGILSAYRAGMKPVMIPDIVKPNGEISKILYANLPTLLDVIKLLNNQNKNL